MQADPRIKIGSVVAAIPGNPMSTRWVVQEIRQRGEHTDYYGRGLGEVFPEPMNTNHLKPPELLYENWQDAVTAFGSTTQLAAQIKWLAMPEFLYADYDRLCALNRRWSEAPEPPVHATQPPLPEIGPLAIPYAVADAIFKAGYRVDRLGFTEISDTIWLRRSDGTGYAYTVQSPAHITANVWALIIKPLNPPPATPEGTLYVRPASAATGSCVVGFTPEHFLYLTRDEAITVIEQLSEMVGYVKGHP